MAEQEMLHIQAKAKEYHRVIRVLNKHSTIVDTQCSEMFVKGGNYVLECFESILPFVAKKGIIYGKIKETIEQLKK